MEFLKELLGEHYAEFEKLLNEYNGNPANAEKQIKLANLAGGDYVSKAKYEALENDGKTTAGKLNEANGLIEQLKKSSRTDEGLQAKISEYESTVATLESELQKTKLDAAIKVGLLAEKAEDVDYLTYKLKEANENLELDEKGEIKGWGDKISALKTQCPKMFATGENAGAGFKGFKELGDEQNHSDEPKSLADALRMQYETN